LIPGRRQSEDNRAFAFNLEGYVRPFLYRCPVLGQTVQSWTNDDLGGSQFETVTCIACRRTHLVDPKSGAVAGVQDDRQAPAGR
jgi:hypothetical protein